ncbi:MAG: hypothetical protein LUG61_04915 [Lachnospiraceae bacterium]|nr:hypothetical protein [Lachnospiraceae bacterium]
MTSVAKKKCLEALNTQKLNCRLYPGEEQNAYYKGMRDMLELVISDAYESGKYLEYNQETETHEIKKA